MILTSEAGLKDKLRAIFKLFDLNDADIINRSDMLFCIENCCIAACRLRTLSTDTLYNDIKEEYIDGLVSKMFPFNLNHLVR